MKLKKTKKRITRKEPKILITISITSDMVDRVERLAKAEKRTRSNFIANAMQQIVDKAEVEV